MTRGPGDRRPGGVCNDLRWVLPCQPEPTRPPDGVSGLIDLTFDVRSVTIVAPAQAAEQCPLSPTIRARCVIQNTRCQDVRPMLSMGALGSCVGVNPLAFRPRCAASTLRLSNAGATYWGSRMLGDRGDGIQPDQVARAKGP